MYKRKDLINHFKEARHLRALHRYRRGHGFKYRSDLNFFQALNSQLLKLCA